MIESQRDEFIKVLYKRAKKDKNICILSADFGAPALDIFIKELPSQFYHLGISEQNMIDVAIGLALKGRKVFCYAMAPFISIRCLEQHKTAGLMNLPIVTLVAGVGLGYADAGPTHYATEDYGSLGSLINSKVYTISDGKMSTKLSNKLCTKTEYCFVRIDRNVTPNLQKDIKNSEIKNGLRYLSKGNNTCVITRGYMSYKSLIIFKKYEFMQKFTLIDLFKSKPLPLVMKNILKKYKKIIVIDEQVERSSIGLPISHFILKHNIKSKVTFLNLDEKYVFENGGRDKLLDLHGLSESNIIKAIEKK
tara:strand:+ start:4941 stop:5858 length:918 start_codon:yes stop_codon:yes gene_type:complete